MTQFYIIDIFTYIKKEGKNHNIWSIVEILDFLNELFGINVLIKEILLTSYHLFFIADEIDAESQAFFENEPVNSISKQEGLNNIAGWLSFTAPKLSKLGKRKISPEIPLEPEFVSSTWIDLQNRGT